MNLTRAHKKNRAVGNFVWSKIYFMMTGSFFQSQNEKELVPVKVLHHRVAGKQNSDITNAEIFRSIRLILSGSDFPNRNVFHGLILNGRLYIEFRRPGVAVLNYMPGNILLTQFKINMVGLNSRRRECEWPFFPNQLLSRTLFFNFRSITAIHLSSVTYHTVILSSTSRKENAHVRSQNFS